jgi:hypothetical protein
MLALVFTLAAVAAPPSSTLTGPDGTLAWSVSAAADGVAIEGSSPKWTVSHTATADLRPLRTERTTADGAHHTVVYDATGATVTGPDGVLRVDQAGLWDADTVDVRLGQMVASGQTEVRFDAIDLGGPKVYTFQAAVVGQQDCAGTPCTAVDLTLTGLLRLVGPTWHYAFGADGRLLRFDGPAGSFAVGGAK